MGGVITYIIDAVEEVLTFTEVALLELYTWAQESWKRYIDPVIEEIFSWLGVTDQDILSTDVVTVPLFETRKGNTLTQLLLEAHAFEVDTVEKINTYTVAGVSGTLRNFYKAAAEHYPNGDMVISATQLDSKTAEVQALLDSLFTPVTFTEHKVGPLLVTPWGYYYLQNTFGYNLSTDILQYGGENWYHASFVYDETTSNYKITLTRTITTVVTEITTVEVVTDATYTTTTTTVDTLTEVNNMTTTTPSTVYGTPVVVQEPAGDGLGDGTFVSSVVISTTVGSEGLTMTERLSVPPASTFYQTYYTVDSDTNHYERIWLYARGTGTYPTLDSGDAYISGLEMLPIVQIRRNYVNIRSGHARYLGTKETLDSVHLDIDDLLNSLDGNPDVAKLSNAFIMAGLNVSIPTKVERKAMWEILDSLHDTSRNGQSLLVRTRSGGGWEDPGTYYTTFSATTCSKTRATGVVCGVLDYTVTIDGANSTLVLKKQILPDTYDTYTLTGVTGTQFIWENSLGQLELSIKTYTLADTSDFLIPMSYGILNKMSTFEQSLLTQSTLHLVVYAAQYQHLEYYQTPVFGELFKFAMDALALYMLVATLGSSASWKSKLWSLVKQIVAKEILKKVLEDSNTPTWLKVVAIAAYTAFAYTEGIKLNKDGVGTAFDLIDGVSNFAEGLLTLEGIKLAKKASEVEAEQDAWNKKVEARGTELAEQTKEYEVYLGIEYIVRNARAPMEPGYVNGHSMWHYKAIDQQYDFDRAVTIQGQRQLYDYDQAFRLGVV